MSNCMTGKAKSDLGSGRIKKGFTLTNVVTSSTKKPSSSELKRALEEHGIDPNGICNVDWWEWELN